ncbi:Phospholipid-binding protein [Caballeronia glathei]|uniref:Phosphatidylethanolamine-binding protein n=1 Tax=Caballeronia glathei TaxID=60547 RepID=A0A069PLR0_9BURK|nr:phosphatidylethanolamine-binding protein [Caballeronia glathei]TCK41943.1 PBP family phospholipid-binding protein [Paraburkholderia sp. BL8N3]CDY73497.1 Phospholipid-binding protein [Caballeronia glathei]
MRLACSDVRLAVSCFRRSCLALSMLCAAAIAANVPRASAQTTFTLTSTDLPAGKPVPPSLLFDQTDCKGGNRSPQLSWHGAPAATRSFAITMIDPDAPGRGWWHWAVAGIPATVTQLPGNASASGALRKMGAVESRNDFDVDGYGGPCPPAGKPHRYVITVYALDSDDLRLRQGRPALMFEHEIRATTLATAQLIFTYGR